MSDTLKGRRSKGSAKKCDYGKMGGGGKMMMDMDEADEKPMKPPKRKKRGHK